MSRTTFVAIASLVILGGMISCATRGSSTNVGGTGAQASATVQPERQAPLLSPGKSLVYNFDQDAAGVIPPGFHGALTGQGSDSKWAVTADGSAPSPPNVLAQLSQDRTDYRFPLAIADDASFENLDLSVKFKAVSGDIDRAAGLVFRLKDANNYYIVRANALEDNYRLYRVVAGKRQQFAGANVRVTSGEWHELRVECVGNRIVCYFDGDKKIESSDDTFKQAGKIGLWTKADSVTYFDDLHVTAK
jgi:3-keto-disaccharide hydrolase